MERTLFGRADIARLPALLAVVLLAGCASGPDPDEAPRPLRFAVIAAPSVGQEPAEPAPGGEAPSPGGAAAEEPLSSEDLLLEAVTQLSGQGELHYVLVPGPLLARPEPELHAALGGALGSLAAAVIVALAEPDGPREALIEALDEALRERSGEAGQWGPVREGWRALALTPEGGWPEAAEARAKGKAKARAADDEAPPRLLVVHAGPPQPGALARGALSVTAGAEAALRREDGRVVLIVPPLIRPPHEVALVTVAEGRVSVRLRSLAGKERELPPVQLPASTRQD